VRAKDVLGRYGEELAAKELVGRGLVLLDRNWRCDLGEIDLVLRDGKDLVVCEVKTRSSTAYGSPLEAVDWAKVRRLHKLGYRWLEEHDLHAPVIRVDVVAVLAPRGGPVSLQHLRDIA
jgi:putative endonuclease